MVVGSLTMPAMTTRATIDRLTLLRYRNLVACRIVTNRTTLRRWMERAADPFPAAIQLSENSIAWRAMDVEAWLERRSIGRLQRRMPAD
jgi:predicted DNA-binding transcriptional regulator AlpA